MRQHHCLLKLLEVPKTESKLFRAALARFERLRNAWVPHLNLDRARDNGRSETWIKVALKTNCDSPLDVTLNRFTRKPWSAPSGIIISRKNPSSVSKSAFSLCNWVNSSRKATAVYFWVSIISSLSVKRPRKRAFVAVAGHSPSWLYTLYLIGRRKRPKATPDRL